MQSAYTAECLTKRTEQSERRAPLRPLGLGGRGRDPSRVSLRPTDLIRGDGRVRCVVPRLGSSAPLTLAGGGEGKVKGLSEGNFACKPLDPVVLKIYPETCAKAG
jgi:hypothetical protein